jgi:tetratricopeptide (TPR) repeat protein
LPGGRARLRFSFQEIVTLKLVKALVDDGVNLRRARRELIALRDRVPTETPLSSLNIQVRNGHVVVADATTVWRADSGQLFFGFEEPEEAPAEITALPRRNEFEAIEPFSGMSADEWIERGLTSEEDDPVGAITAYKKALHLRPECVETLINLGRLYAETGEDEDAETCFRKAVKLSPDDATAIYNLGVVVQDCGRDQEAIDHYLRALEIDPSFAEAHYNLATIFDRSGDAQAAIRHINAFRRLTKPS